VDVSDRSERLEGVANDLEWIAQLLGISLAACDELDVGVADSTMPAVHRIWKTRRQMWHSLVPYEPTPQFLVDGMYRLVEERLRQDDVESRPA
jgi:hypothetical protein